jgi:hypothetical protein
VIGVVRSIERGAAGTELAIATADGPRRVYVPAEADPVGARRVHNALRRCVAVRLTYADATWSSVVRGVGHHRPVDLPVSLATAVALIGGGLPAVVSAP